MKLITKTKDLAAVCDALAQNEFVALDTEFIRETTFWPQLCLIQAAGGETEALIDPLSDELDLAPLFELLADKSTEKVFHACRQDLEIFFHKGGELIPQPLFDTQIAAMAVGLGDSISYDNLVRELLGRHIDKGSRFTDWARRPLSEKQLAYALADVTHLRDLYPTLKARLKTMEREHWVAEEMKTLTNPETYRMDPESAWKRLKIRKTTKKWLAALKAAELLDTGRRGVPKGFERSKPAERLIEALSDALNNPDAYAPHIDRTPPTPPNLGPVVEMLKVFLRVVAEDEGVAPRLIATVPDLELIAASEGDNPNLYSDAAEAGWVTMKAQGNQWNWTYSFPDELDEAGYPADFGGSALQAHDK